MKRNWAKFLILCGSLCLVAALILTGYNLYDEQRAEKSANAGLIELRTEIIEKAPEAQPVVPEPQVMMTSVTTDGHTYVGILHIPSLELSLPIQRDWSDQLLKHSPCLYHGTIYEGMIIAGHNYRSHFSKLPNLLLGDSVTFTDVEGNTWSYVLAGTEIIDGNDVERMKNGNWDLTLFTCTYGGRERYTLRFNLIPN